MQSPTSAKTDVEVSNEGTVFAFQPLTPEAEHFFKEEVKTEPWQWFGSSLIVDHRYAREFALACNENGLVVR